MQSTQEGGHLTVRTACTCHALAVMALHDAKAQHPATNLVGHIKEGQQVLALADVCNLAPLLLCRVNAGGVVRTSCTKHTGIAQQTRQPSTRCTKNKAT